MPRPNVPDSYLNQSNLRFLLGQEPPFHLDALKILNAVFTPDEIRETLIEQEEQQLSE